MIGQEFRKPKRLRISETVYLHMRIQTEALDALAILREAEINADVISKSRGGYEDIHEAIRQAYSLLAGVRDAMWQHDVDG